MLRFGAVRVYPRRYAERRIPQYPVRADRRAAQSDDRHAEADDPVGRAFDKHSDIILLLNKNLYHLLRKFRIALLGSLTYVSMPVLPASLCEIYP